MRIVSLLPSATEIICELGIQDQLVGVTHECDYPLGVLGLPKVTQTLIPADATSREIDAMVREELKTSRALYSLDLSVLERLQPDLIVTQALCDVCAVAESEVRQAACSLPGNPQVINLEPMCLEDVFRCIEQVGEATGSIAQAQQAINRLRLRVATLLERSSRLEHRPSMMLLEWIDPPFSAGHWNPELVRMAGGRELIGESGKKSQTTPWESIVDADPEVLVISCCGFNVERALVDIPILKSYPRWNDLSCVRNHRVYVVDGSAYFSRPGPRLVDSLELLANTLHPTIHPLPKHLSAAMQIA